MRKLERLKKGIFLVQFQKKARKVIPYSANFVSAGFVRDRMVLEVNCQRLMSLNAGLAYGRKQAQQRSVQA